MAELGGAGTTRRKLLTGAAAGAALLTAGCDLLRKPQAPTASSDAATRSRPADVTLRVGTILVDVAKDHTISTIGYNGSAPGPLIRLKEGVPVTVELINQTNSPEMVHWHGMEIPSDIEGAQVAAHSSLRYSLTPASAGMRFVHSDAMALADLNRGTYTGQYAPVYVEPKNDAGKYDREVFLTTHEWEPFFKKGNGLEIAYQRFTMNGKCLGFGEPVRVKFGERVLFHIVNANATENIELALAGHRFLVVGLDGNAVPKPQTIDVLQLGAAERVDAIVEMKNPGVWILATPEDNDRRAGMGIVVEYANKSGAPLWTPPPSKNWDYTAFGDLRPPALPDEVIPLVFGKIGGGAGGFNLWTVNGRSFEEKDKPRVLQSGKRYRLSLMNQTDEPHPVHLQRNVFELVAVGGKATGGIFKDVVLLKSFETVEVDVVPTITGPALFHCHQQLQMDFGFKFLFEVT